MPGTRFHSPVDATRQRILSAARRVFAARPEMPPTLGEVARSAGVSRATLHRHFHSREELLRAADVEPEPGARERALAAAIDLLARDGLAHLSMDEVAERAGVSRANLYRLFPGKPALFTEMIRVYSPFESIAATVTELRSEPPEVVMPAVARAAARHLEGRVGLVRAMIFEVAAPSSDAEAARELAIRNALGPLSAYIAREIEAGRLRPMDPLLAVQAFAGPIVFHLVLRAVAERMLGFDLPLEEAVARLAEHWVAAMRPPAQK